MNFIFFFHIFFGVCVRYYSPSASSLLSALKLGLPRAPGVGTCFAILFVATALVSRR